MAAALAGYTQKGIPAFGIYGRDALQPYASPFHSYLSILLGKTAIFIIGFLGGVIINRSNRKK